MKHSAQVHHLLFARLDFSQIYLTEGTRRSNNSLMVIVGQGLSKRFAVSG